MAKLLTKFLRRKSFIIQLIIGLFGITLVFNIVYLDNIDSEQIKVVKPRHDDHLLKAKPPNTKNPVAITEEHPKFEKLVEDPIKNEDPEIHNPIQMLPLEEANGPGEMGKPVNLPTDLDPETKKKVDEGWTNNSFNEYVSDMISVHRSLPDPRDEWCKVPGRYLENLPATSVIVCFYNEAWSVLLRTVHSILDRSPAHLLTEIVLVDDFSNMDHLKSQLDDYMALYPKVKILHLKQREGLIRARLMGTEVATGPVLTFLDSHCECATGWLTPLLDRIARDPWVVVCPTIPIISDVTFEFRYKKANDIQIGGFNWNLQFRWHVIPQREKDRRIHPAEPVYSPTMSGGLFSIDKKFFERLGTYDPGFDFWGSENLELSFKTWMCGGTLEIIPCSHVGHIYRKKSPYKWKKEINVIRRNSIRLAEVWLDEYKSYHYDMIGHNLLDFGNVSERKALRAKLGCKSFKWYLDNIYPEMFVPGDAIASGEIRNDWSGMCINADARSGNYKKSVGVKHCHNRGGFQSWMLSKEGEIRRLEACFDFAGANVTLYQCHGSKENQFWEYNHENLEIVHKSKMCLTITSDKKKLLMEECNLDEERQRWKFEKYNP